MGLNAPDVRAWGDRREPQDFKQRSLGLKATYDGRRVRMRDIQPRRYSLQILGLPLVAPGFAINGLQPQEMKMRLSVIALMTLSLLAFVGCQTTSANGDAAGDISDASMILSVLFLGGDMVPCRDSADVNADGALEVSDAVGVLA